MGVLAILAWVGFAAVIALCVAAFFALAPQAIEDDAHQRPEGDCFPFIPKIHEPGNKL